MVGTSPTKIILRMPSLQKVVFVTLRLCKKTMRPCKEALSLCNVTLRPCKEVLSLCKTNLSHCIVILRPCIVAKAAQQRRRTRNGLRWHCRSLHERITSVPPIPSYVSVLGHLASGFGRSWNFTAL